MPTHVERMVVHETCMAAQAVHIGNAFNVAQHQTDEPVALPPHSIHDRATIDAYDTIMVHTEARRCFDGVGRIRRSDEQLARHAADAGASGAIGAAFDEHCGRACSPGSAVRGKACRPGADDGDVSPHNPHVEASALSGGTNAAGPAGRNNGRGKTNPGRNSRSLTLAAKESGEGNLHRSQDLPYCTFALLTHVFFAGPASASHFSIATL